MTVLSDETRETLRGMSAYGVIQSVYDKWLRPNLPKHKLVWNNGVPAQSGKIFDLQRDRYWHKAGSIEALREYLEPTDHLVTVGQVWGAPAVVGVRRGETVTVIEAGKDNVEFLRRYFQKLRIDDLIEVKHALVADADIDTWGGEIGETLPAAELPECDVLELDCEGAELPILKGLTQRPRVCIVEPHVQFDTPPDLIISQLTEMGYRTVYENVVDYGRQTAIIGTDYDSDMDSQKGGKEAVQ